MLDVLHRTDERVSRAPSQQEGPVVVDGRAWAQLTHLHLSPLADKTSVPGLGRSTGAPTHDGEGGTSGTCSEMRDLIKSWVI